MSNMVYEAREDSHLLISTLPESLQGKTVLEIGCGSGVVSVEAARRGGKVTAVDIDHDAVVETQSAAMHAHLPIEVLQGDMFIPVKDRSFDLVVCNPPYLPDEPKDPNIALDGGPNGWEWIARFLRRVGNHISDAGKVHLLYSNRSDEEMVRKLIFDQGFMRRELVQKGVGLGEVLFVDELTPYLARGSRGFTYTEDRDGKAVLVKELRDDTDADTLGNEAQFLQVLNKVGIGPRFISFDGKRLVREFVDGLRIDEFFDHCSAADARSVLSQVFHQCQQMDALRINKLEMTNPYKHVLVVKDSKMVKAVMIDFERCKYTIKPKNVTQFAQYVVKPEVIERLARIGVPIDREQIIKLATEYKHKGFDDSVFAALIKQLEG